MKLEELRQSIFRLTPDEIEYKKGNEFNAFYDYLKKNGSYNFEGYYNIPDYKMIVPGHHEHGTIWDQFSRSPHQKEMMINKSSRFFHEPLLTGKFIALRYIYSGNVEQRHLNNEILALRKNDILLMNANLGASHYLADENDISFTIVFNRDSILRDILGKIESSSVISRFMSNFIMNTQNKNNYILFHAKDNEIIPDIFEKLLLEYIEPTSNGYNLIQNYMQIIFIEMLYSPFEFNQTVNGNRSFKIAEILDYIENNYKTVTLQTLSNQFGYTSKYISDMISTYCNHGFKEIVQNKRLKHATYLLENEPTKSIHDILLESGFSNESFFYRKFKEKYGISPKEFRERQKSASAD